LMSEILKILSAKKEIKKLYLDVHAQQPAAVALYQKVGFTIVDELDGVTGDGVPYKEFVMFRKNIV